MDGRVIAVACDAMHRFGKPIRDSIELLPGLGVAGDAHCGASVQHRSRLARSPGAPNLRQVHLVQAELFDELAAAGFEVRPGELGENVTTTAVDLLGLSTGTRMRVGGTALIEVTGLRNPCRQIDDNLGHGAMNAVLGFDAAGRLTRKAGVMAIVLEGGIVRSGDTIALHAAPRTFVPLAPV